MLGLSFIAAACIEGFDSLALPYFILRVHLLVKV